MQKLDRDRFRRPTHQRPALGLFLLAIYVALPWIKINGFPAVFLDVASRRFHLLGLTLVVEGRPAGRGHRQVDRRGVDGLGVGALQQLLPIGHPQARGLGRRQTYERHEEKIGPGFPDPGLVGAVEVAEAVVPI